MNKPPLLLALSGALALLGAVLLPRQSSGQDASPVDAALGQHLADVAAQQIILVQNQAKIDEKLALIAEDVRIGRIYVSRGGGKAKP